MDREVGTNSTEAIGVPVAEAEEALGGMRVGFFGDPAEDTSGLVEDIPETLGVLGDRAFTRAAEQVVARLESNDSRGAQELANTGLDSEFRETTQVLVGIRSELRAEIKSSDEFLGRWVR